jgi:hypothetical protein
MRHSCLVNAAPKSPRRVVHIPLGGCTGDGVVPSPVHRAERLTIPGGHGVRAGAAGETTSFGPWPYERVKIGKNATCEIAMTIRETYLSRQRVAR